MVVGLLTLELFLPDSQSLKDKRSVVRPLVERMRRTWNVSVAEVDHQDIWQRTTLAVAAVNTEAGHAERTLREVLRHAEAQPDLQVLDSSVQIL